MDKPFKITYVYYELNGIKVKKQYNGLFFRDVKKIKKSVIVYGETFYNARKRFERTLDYEIDIQEIEDL